MPHRALVWPENIAFTPGIPTTVTLIHFSYLFFIYFSQYIVFIYELYLDIFYSVSACERSVVRRGTVLSGIQWV